MLMAVPKPVRLVRSRKPLRKVNARRRRARLAEDFGDLAALVRGLPCLVVGCNEPVDPAHVRSRGAGHHAWLDVAGVRTGNIAPLCRAHHQEQHQRGSKTFECRRELVVWLPTAPRRTVDTLAEAARIVGEFAKGKGK